MTGRVLSVLLSYSLKVFANLPRAHCPQYTLKQVTLDPRDGNPIGRCCACSGVLLALNLLKERLEKLWMQMDAKMEASAPPQLSTEDGQDRGFSNWFKALPEVRIRSHASAANYFIESIVADDKVQLRCVFRIHKW